MGLVLELSSSGQIRDRGIRNAITKRDCPPDPIGKSSSPTAHGATARGPPARVRSRVIPDFHEKWGRKEEGGATLDRSVSYPDGGLTG